MKCLKEVEVVSYKVPLIDKDGGASGGTVTREDLARMPGRSAASIASTVGGVQTDGTGIFHLSEGSEVMQHITTLMELKLEVLLAFLKLQLKKLVL